MEMSGEYRIPAPRQKVWEALNDPDMLKRAIPGCESIEKVSDTELAATVTAKVGPVKAKFNGVVTLEDLNPPESYTIRGEGKGGAAGFAKGSSRVHLKEEGEETVLTYNASADVGGKLAQLGSRLIQGTARKYADEFFGNFSRNLTAPEPTPEPVAPPPPEPEPAAVAAKPEARPEPQPRPEPPPQPRPEARPAEPPRRAPEPEPGLLSKPWVWLAGIVLLILLLFLILR